MNYTEISNMDKGVSGVGSPASKPSRGSSLRRVFGKRSVRMTFGILGLLLVGLGCVYKTGGMNARMMSSLPSMNTMHMVRTIPVQYAHHHHSAPGMPNNIPINMGMNPNMMTNSRIGNPNGIAHRFANDMVAPHNVHNVHPPQFHHNVAHAQMNHPPFHNAAPPMPVSAHNIMGNHARMI